MRAFLLSFMIGAVAAAANCTSAPDVAAPECSGSSVCAPPEDSGTGACVGDPSAEPAEERCGVFVSSSFGSDDNPGTRLRPVRSLETAIMLAQAGPARVYACAEVFLEAVVLPGGVELWGGLDCMSDWGYVGEDHKTTIAPGADATPLRLVAGDGVAIVADVRVEAANASLPSGSSIAAMIMPSTAVEILRGELVAGAGAPGEKGEDGGAEPAQAGAPGTSGGNACSADVVPGGPAVTTVCGDITSIGGQGGQATLTVNADGLNGEPEPSPNPMSWGEGGKGATAAMQCGAGKQGLDGADGEDGRGASGPGQLNMSGYEGEMGQDGGDGLPGQGGGGAGGNRGGTLLCGPGINKAGAGGGSGGAGGCGGKGGKGGGYGGASIGLLSLSAQVTVRATTIVASDGGIGGDGGFTQWGGLGGARGLGGDSFYGANSGCHGGRGGGGGRGGFGGGGMGGPSIGIAHLQGFPVVQEDVTIQIGLPGKGGLGGGVDFSIDGTGDDGVAADVFAFP